MASFPSETGVSSDESEDWDLGLLVILLYPYPKEVPFVSDSWINKPKATYFHSDINDIQKKMSCTWSCNFQHSHISL